MTRLETYENGVLIDITFLPPEPSTEDRLDALTDAVEALAFDLLMQQMGGA